MFLTIVILLISVENIFGQHGKKILIINSFDAQSIKARKNKKELFGELPDRIKYTLQNELVTKNNIEVEIIPELIANASENDSVYIDLINKHAASKAIVIKNLNAYFEQTGVEVTKEANGKKRVASYDIHADVTYLLLIDSARVKESEVSVWEFFTERSVVSGFLAAGPDIVGKSKHAFKIIEKNAVQYRKEIQSYLTND